MNDILNDEVINKMILSRLKSFVEKNYGTYSSFASALGMTTSTITSMFNRESLPSGAVLAGIKRLHPEFQLDLLFQDVIKTDSPRPIDSSLLSDKTSNVAELLIGFLKSNEIKVNVTVNHVNAT